MVNSNSRNNNKIKSAKPGLMKSPIYVTLWQLTKYLQVSLVADTWLTNPLQKKMWNLKKKPRLISGQGQHFMAVQSTELHKGRSGLDWFSRGHFRQDTTVKPGCSITLGTLQNLRYYGNDIIGGTINMWSRLWGLALHDTTSGRTL